MARRSATPKPPRPYPFVAYRGALVVGERRWPLRFSVAVRADGEVSFRLPPMPLSRDVFDLERAIDDRDSPTVRWFRLEGEAKDGGWFESDHVYLTGTGHTVTPDRSVAQLRVKASKTRSIRLAEGAARPYVRWCLRGFEAFPDIKAECGLGRLVMAGRYPRPSSHGLNGFLQISATETPADFDAWRHQAERLAWHVLGFMSFAVNETLNPPLVETWDGRTLETLTISVPRRPPSRTPVIHPMIRQTFFETVVTRYFETPDALRPLDHLLEWSSLGGLYVENKLMAAMTALEALVDANLEPDASQLLPTKQFKALAAALRTTARDHFGTLSDTPESRAFLDAIPGKLADLNRRPLAQRIQRLADLWAVPAKDLLEGDGLAGAVRTRNLIVHRGRSSDEGRPRPRDLHDHVDFLRELLIRFILTRLNYRGQYLAYDRGMRFVAFPPASDTYD